MPEQEIQQCTGKCTMVETYKSINKSLTNQNSEMRNLLALKEKEITEFRQLVLSLRAEIAENKKHESLNNMIKAVSIASEAFSVITNTIQSSSAKLSGLNKKILQSVQNGSLDASVSSVSQLSTPIQSKTPTNVSRIRPIIRTPNGLMQSVSISLPRLDHAMFLATAQRTENVSVASENGLSHASSNEGTIQSDDGESVSGTIDENNDTNMIPDVARDAPEVVVTNAVPRLPRYTSESPFHGFDDTEIDANRPNPEVIPAQNDQETYDYEGLSVIHEVTEFDYSVNPTPHHNDDDDSSSGGEEIATLSKRRTENKENRSQKQSISQATCSTPYTRPSNQRVSMKEAKVVLQPLNMDEIASSRPLSRASDSSNEPEIHTQKPPGGRKRKDSEMSENTDTDDDLQSGRNSGRPKRRATPVSFKEPTLREKMRRPK